MCSSPCVIGSQQCFVTIPSSAADVIVFSSSVCSGGGDAHTPGYSSSRWRRRLFPTIVHRLHVSVHPASTRFTVWLTRTRVGGESTFAGQRPGVVRVPWRKPGSHHESISASTAPTAAALDCHQSAVTDNGPFKR
eukprot:1178334-Prorocentrum_minimum.AAC.2